MWREEEENRTRERERARERRNDKDMIFIRGDRRGSGHIITTRPVRTYIDQRIGSTDRSIVSCSYGLYSVGSARLRPHAHAHSGGGPACGNDDPSRPRPAGTRMRGHISHHAHPYIYVVVVASTRTHARLTCMCILRTCGVEHALVVTTLARIQMREAFYGSNSTQQHQRRSFNNYY